MPTYIIFNTQQEPVKVVLSCFICRPVLQARKRSEEDGRSEVKRRGNREPVRLCRSRRRDSAQRAGVPQTGRRLPGMRGPQALYSASSRSLHRPSPLFTAPIHWYSIHIYINTSSISPQPLRHVLAAISAAGHQRFPTGLEQAEGSLPADTLHVSESQPIVLSHSK